MEFSKNRQDIILSFSLTETPTRGGERRLRQPQKAQTGHSEEAFEIKQAEEVQQRNKNS